MINCFKIEQKPFEQSKTRKFNKKWRKTILKDIIK